MTFVLHPRLEADSDFVCDLSLSQVRLSHNAAFPWLILVPRLANVVEIIDLPEEQSLLLYKDIHHASLVMKTLFSPTKLNVANLGNMVSQLHIHVIARFEHDLAWPHPVWNSGIFTPYADSEKSTRLDLLYNALKKA